MSHLPYHRNLRDAIRAQDRPAILAIMAWNRQHPIEYKEEEVLLPREARSCMNSDDYISHEPWSDDYLPNVYIRYMDFDEQISVPLCYRKEDLLRFFETPEHVQAAWIIPYTNPGLYLDDDGKVRSPYNSNYKGYGEPSRVERFVRIPPSYYLEYDSLWEGLNNSSSLLAIPIYQTRVGNVEGSYGESRLHGQAPDVTVYYVVDADAFEDNPERMYNYIYLKIYKLKTDIDLPLATLQQLPSSLEMIQQLQVDFRVAKKDRDFYDETLSINEASGEIQQEDLPKIPPEQLTVETILNTMFNWIVYPPPNRQKLAILYEGIYSQFEFNHKVIQYNNLDQWNTATFVDKDSPLEPESSFITDVFIAFTELSYEDDITSIPLYQEIEEVLNDQNTFVFGSMLILLNEILTPKGLSFWINTVTPMEIGPMSLSFGGYQIPEISHHIYDVILNSTFEASRINTDHYMEIKYWDQFPEGLAIHDVINFILSHPMIRNQIFERYHLDKYDTYINIEDIYNMFYILFEAGYKLDSHTFEISAMAL